MVGGRLRCLSCAFTCSSVLLLWVGLNDVEASSCQRVIHKKVGDTVELSSCLPAEGVTFARWKYGDFTIAENGGVSKRDQFMGRLDLNPTNLSLTLRRLTLQDSGDFQFVSGDSEKQRDTVIITLQVYEPITKPPDLTSNLTWDNVNKSCTVFLECSATSGSSVNYNWTVRNQSRSGSRLKYVIRQQDGDTNFTCTIYNNVSEMSASEIIKCSNDTQEPGMTPLFPGRETIILMAGGGAACLLVVVLAIVIGVCCCKRQPAGSELTDLTVYADISEVAIEDENLSTMKPCSVYETIDNRGNSVPLGPQTVYDKIQLSRVRKPSVSPYQEVS